MIHRKGIQALIGAWPRVRAPRMVAVFRKALSECHGYFHMQCILSFDFQSTHASPWDLSSIITDSEILHVFEFPYLSNGDDGGCEDELS